MATDDTPGREDTQADLSSVSSAASAGHEWSTVPADWFEPEPAARRLRMDFQELCRRASAEQITDALGAIWLMLDRAALWVSSIHTDLAANSTDLIDRTCAALLPTIPHRIRTLTCLGRASLDHLPTAMAAARAAFEAGLRLAWTEASQVPQERAIRVLLIHSSQAAWKRKVASDYDLSSAGGDRWRQAAKVQEDMVSRALGMIGSPELPKRVPSVAQQLRELGLDRLYSGYRLASEYVHGGLTSALDAETVQAENSPFGAYWPNDWYLAVTMCAWGCVFLPRRYVNRGFDLGPMRGSMLAAELMFLSPGTGWRQGS
jgi:hypothetical protein